VEVNTCHPSYEGSINRRTVVQASLGINVRTCLKNTYSKKDWGYDPNVEYLPSKLKALNSSPSTSKKIKIKKKNR
jgi:hypothetical protein